MRRLVLALMMVAATAGAFAEGTTLGLGGGLCTPAIVENDVVVSIRTRAIAVHIGGFAGDRLGFSWQAAVCRPMNAVIAVREGSATVTSEPLNVGRPSTVVGLLLGPGYRISLGDAKALICSAGLATTFGALGEILWWTGGPGAGLEYRMASDDRSGLALGVSGSYELLDIFRLAGLTPDWYGSATLRGASLIGAYLGFYF